MVIDHKLYWSAVTSLEEGLYLASILGSEAARKRVENLQSRGQWGARDFDKVMFTLPIPRFDPKNPLHKGLAAAGAAAQRIASKVEIVDDMHFLAARRAIRGALNASGASAKIDQLVDSIVEARA